MSDKTQRVQLSPEVSLCFPARDRIYLEVERDGKLFYSEIFSNVEKIADRYHERFWPSDV